MLRHTLFIVPESIAQPTHSLPSHHYDPATPVALTANIHPASNMYNMECESSSSFFENNTVMHNLGQAMSDSFKSKSHAKLLRYMKNIKENLPELQKQEAKWAAEQSVRLDKQHIHVRVVNGHKRNRLQGVWDKKEEEVIVPTGPAGHNFLSPHPTPRPTLGDAIREPKEYAKAPAGSIWLRPIVCRPHVPKGPSKRREGSQIATTSVHPSLKRTRPAEESDDEEEQPPTKKRVRWNDESSIIPTQEKITLPGHEACMNIQEKPKPGSRVQVQLASFPPPASKRSPLKLVQAPTPIRRSEWRRIEKANAARRTRVEDLRKWVLLKSTLKLKP